MALPGKKKRGGSTSAPLDPHNSLGVQAVTAVDSGLGNVTADAVIKGASLVADGGAALGELAKSGLRLARSKTIEGAASGVVNVAGDAISAVTQAAGPAAGAVAGAAGDVLSSAADLAGPALEAAGEAAGAVLGAVAEAAGDALS